MIRSPDENRQFLTEGKRIMPGTRFTEFPALSVEPMVGISRSVLFDLKRYSL